MSDVRLYVDEDAGENAVVQGIRARGFDVLTTIEAHQCGATDQDQLALRSNSDEPFTRSTWVILRDCIASVSCRASTIPASSCCPTSVALSAKRFDGWPALSAV